MKRITTLLAILLACLIPLLSFTACGAKNKIAVGTCGEYEVLYDELRFQTLMYLEDHPDCTEEELDAAVKDALCRQYAILLLCKEYLPTVSVEDASIQEAVDAAVESAITAQGSKSAYKKMLKERYLNKDLMNRMLSVAQMQVELEKIIYKGTELESADAFGAWLTNGNCVRIRRMYFPATSFSADEVAAIRLSLLAGADPLTLLNTEQKNNGATLYQPDYYFRGLNETDAEAAAFTLSTVGDVSTVVSDVNGYSILIRVENDFENLVNYQKETAFNRYRENRLNALLDEAAAKLSVQWNAYGSEIELLNIG